MSTKKEVTLLTREQIMGAVPTSENLTIEAFYKDFKNAASSHGKLARDISALSAGVTRQSDSKEVRRTAELIASFVGAVVNTWVVENIDIKVMATPKADRSPSQEIKFNRYTLNKKAILNAAGYCSATVQTTLGFKVSSVNRPKTWVDGELHSYKAEAVAVAVQSNGGEADPSDEDDSDGGKAPRSLEEAWGNLIGVYGLDGIAEYCAKYYVQGGQFHDTFVGHVTLLEATVEPKHKKAQAKTLAA